MGDELEVSNVSQEEQQHESTETGSSEVSTEGYAENMPEGLEAQTDGAANDDVTSEGEPGERKEVEKELAVDDGSEKYVPNLKFKAGREEKDFPDWVKPLVTKENEENIRDIFSKVEGFDQFKKNSDDFRAQTAGVYQAHNSLVADLQDKATHLKNGDLDGFFDSIGLNEDAVMHWAVERAKFSQLPKEDQDRHNRIRTAEREASQLRRANQGLTEANVNTQSQAKAFELDTSLASPELIALASDFDSFVDDEGKSNKPGDFRARVIQEAAFQETMTGKTLSAKQAIQHTLRVLRMKSGVASQAAKPNPTNPATAPKSKVMPAAKKPTVIPNIQGTNTSSVGSTARNIEDLKAIYRGKYGANA